MPTIQADTRILFGIIAAIAAILSAAIGNVLAINIVYFFARQGPRPIKQPIRLWFIFYFSASISVFLGSLAAFAPAPPVDEISNLLRKSINDAPDDVKIALDDLSKGEFIDLIKDGNDTPGEKEGLANCASEAEFHEWFPSYAEFERRGLLVIMPEKEDGCNEYQFYWVWSSLGSRSYEFVLEIIGNAYGDIRLDVERELIARAPANIQKAVSGLSKEALLFLIKNGDEEHGGGFGLYCDSTKEAFYAIPGFAELEYRGLVEFYFQDFLDCPSELFWQTTPLGDDAYRFVIEIISEALEQSFR